MFAAHPLQEIKLAAPGLPVLLGDMEKNSTGHTAVCWRPVLGTASTDVQKLQRVFRHGRPPPPHNHQHVAPPSTSIIRGILRGSGGIGVGYGQLDPMLGSQGGAS